MNLDFQSWRCCHDNALFCPPEGCPVDYGCARQKGWQPGDESPRECRGLPALENLLSRPETSMEQHERECRDSALAAVAEREAERLLDAEYGTRIPHRCIADGHRWTFIGGMPCPLTLGMCSRGVHRCSECGDCDYGESAEALAECRRCENHPENAQ